jgi:hypothetical protein
MRRHGSALRVALLLCLVLGLGVSFAPGSPVPPADQRTAEDVRLVDVGDDGARLWPFTSRRRSFDSLTLPINLVVEGRPARVRSLLAGDRGEWNASTQEWQGISGEGDPAGAGFSAATGADRYTYVDTPGPGGEWVDETGQLHDGTYFGSRLHLRLYGSPGADRDWTAIQAHRDYWDWFRLRHSVTSLASPRHRVERDLAVQPAVGTVSRERFANGGILDADGWATVVELRPRREATPVTRPPAATALESDRSPAPPPQPGTGTSLPAAAGFAPLAALAAAAVLDAGRVAPSGGQLLERLRWSRLADRRYHRLALFVLALFALPLAVRAASLWLETWLPQRPKLVAGLLYPVFALGPPAIAVLVPRWFDLDTWFLAAVLAYGSGLVVDLGSIGVASVPVSVVVHRFFVLLALGTLAAVGRARSSDDPPGRLAVLAAGGLWTSLLAWPLFVGV